MSVEMVRIGDICTVVSGSTPKTSVAEYWDGDIKWITPAELDETTFYLHDSVRHITELGKEKTGLSYMPAGTVILSSRAPIGKTAIAGCEMCCNQGFKNLICSEKIYNEYLYYFLSAKTDYLNSLGRGATFKEISKSIVENIVIPLPQISEQKQISNRFTQIDALIRLRKEQLEQLDQLVKSRFIELFGDVKTGEYKFDTRKLGEVANVGSSHRVFTSEFVEDGVPFYRGTEIGELANGIKPKNPYRITKEHCDRLASDETKPQIGDLLMPSICNKGQVWMVDTAEPFYYKDGRVLCISPNRNLFNCKYLERFMREKTLAEYPKLGSGSTFAEFKIFLLKDIDVLIPPIELQNEFAAFVEHTDKLKFAVYNAASLQIALLISLKNNWKHRASVSNKGVSP